MFVQTAATVLPEQALPADLQLLSIVQILLLLPVALQARTIHAAAVLTVHRAAHHQAHAQMNQAEAAVHTVHLVVHLHPAPVVHLVAAVAEDHTVVVVLHQEVHPLVVAAEDNFSNNKYLTNKI